VIVAKPNPRFLLLADVAEILNISSAQAYALVRNGDLPAIKVGGRGQWRVEATELEAYIQRLYAETRDFVDRHPLGASDSAMGPRSSAGAGDDDQTL
jgi:excisionase family DNA binding protein